MARRLRLGVLLPPRMRASRPARCGSAAPVASHDAALPSKGSPGSSSLPPLPRGFGWMPYYLPETAAYVEELQALLADPEMAALIAAEPRVRRVLRPLCHMMGVAPPPGLAPAKSSKPKRSSKSARIKRPRKAHVRGSAPESLEQSVWREMGLADKPPHPA